MTKIRQIARPITLLPLAGFAETSEGVLAGFTCYENAENHINPALRLQDVQREVGRENARHLLAEFPPSLRRACEPARGCGMFAANAADVSRAEPLYIHCRATMRCRSQHSSRPGSPRYN